MLFHICQYAQSQYMLSLLSMTWNTINVGVKHQSTNTSKYYPETHHPAHEIIELSCFYKSFRTFNARQALNEYWLISN